MFFARSLPFLTILYSAWLRGENLTSGKRKKNAAKKHEDREYKYMVPEVDSYKDDFHKSEFIFKVYKKEIYSYVITYTCIAAGIGFASILAINYLSPYFGFFFGFIFGMIFNTAIVSSYLYLKGDEYSNDRRKDYLYSRKN